MIGLLLFAGFYVTMGLLFRIYAEVKVAKEEKRAQQADFVESKLTELKRIQRNDNTYNYKNIG